MVTGATGFNTTDPGCGTATDPDMVPGHSLCADITTPQVTAQATGPPQSVRLWWQPDPLARTRPQLSAQTLGICYQSSLVTGDPDTDAVPGCGTTMDPNMAPRKLRPQTIPWHQVATQFTQIRMTPAPTSPSDPDMATGGGSEPRHPCDFWW